MALVYVCVTHIANKCITMIVLDVTCYTKMHKTKGANMYKKLVIDLIKTIDNEKLLAYLFYFIKCCKENENDFLGRED